jgi:catalase
VREAIGKCDPIAFDPVNLTDGIELSDDPLPALRSRVYMLSALNRRQQ